MKHSEKNAKRKMQNLNITLQMPCDYSAPAEVRLGDGSLILVHTITSIEQLEKIKDILASAVEVAIDTEFISQKANIAKLKVLQLAIGNQGFAFVIEKLDINLVRYALERILTDPDVLRIAWSFVSDASVIQAALGITCGRTFDLQAKLRSAKNGHVYNLRRAMQEYCADWCGQEIFDRLKGASKGYMFGKENCVWNMEPLPEEAIMYSIFDAVALLELWARLNYLENLDEHFWPDYTSEEVRKKYRTRKEKNASANKLKRDIMVDNP